MLHDLRSASRTIDTEDILVFLLDRRLSESLWRPDQQLPRVLGDVILDSLFERKLRTIICAKMAKTATAVEVLRIPSVSPLYNSNALFWADPGAYSTARATVEV